VLAYLGPYLADLLATGAGATELDAAIDRQSRGVARTSLDGYPVGELQTRFPNVAQLVERLRHQDLTERDARLAAAHVNALRLSWRLFGDFLRISAGLDDLTDDELTQSLAQATSRIARPESVKVLASRARLIQWPSAAGAPSRTPRRGLIQTGFPSRVFPDAPVLSPPTLPEPSP